MRHANRGMRLWNVAATIAVLATFVSPAEAGLGRRLVRGLTYTLTPNIGTVQNGPNFNNNLFTQRFNENPLTDGRSYEVVRIFGDDSFGNPDTLNLGLVNLQMRQPDGSPFFGAGVYSRVGYNMRLVPEVYWDFRTTGRNISGFSGASSVTTPLQYTIETNDGLTNARINGQILVNSRGSANILGFYDVELTASNTGTLETNGLLSDRDQDLDFDIGPVNVSGNFAVDTIFAVLDVIGEQIFGLPAEQFNPIMRQKSADEIADLVSVGQSITMTEFNTLMAAYAENPDAFDLPTSEEVVNRGDSVAQFTNVVPEPGTALLLITAGVLPLWSRSRRRDRR